MDGDQSGSHAQPQVASESRGRSDHQRRFGRRVQRHDSRHRRLDDARGEIWVGTDDGLVQLDARRRQALDATSRRRARRSSAASQRSRRRRSSDGTAYAIDDGHEMGDNAPYVFVTHDFGKHWTKIVNGLPADQWARSIRPDIRNRDLVYLGTEEGIWISFDGGAHWQSFKNDLPTVSVHDIRMQPHVRRSRDRDARPLRLHHGRRAARPRAAAGDRARHVALYAAHRVRVDAAPKRRGNLHELRGRQSAVRRDDHVLPEGARRRARRRSRFSTRADA